MNLLIALAVFPVIFIGELPDKTMFASLVLATRGRPGAVWIGASAAFAIHMVFAVTVGTVAVLLLPRRMLDIVVAALFLAGALLSVRELIQARRGGDEAKVETALATGFARAALTAFGVVFVAEWGDLTQILAANLAAHYRAPLAVGVGATVALWAVAGVAVIGGRWLVRVIDAAILRGITAVVLAGFAGYAGWLAANA